MFDRKSKGKGLIFIVEDNAAYAKVLGIFLADEFPEAKIKIYPVGEVCIDNLHHNPDAIIIDYELNSKYYDAADGLEIVREIRSKKPEVNIILLSAQENVQVAVAAIEETKSHYVPKGGDAFQKVAALLKKGKLA